MKSKAALFLDIGLGLGLLSAVFASAAYSRDVDNLEEGMPLELLNQIGGSVLGVAQAGNFAYIGVGPRLTVLDVQDLANPVFVGASEVLPGVLTHIEVTGSHVFAAVYGDMLVLDVSNPADPTQVGTFDPEGFVSRFVISGSLAYVGEQPNRFGGGGGLRVVDISNPTNPSQVGYLGPIGRTADVAIWSNYVYISGIFPNVDRIKVIDVSNPANPTDIDTTDTSGTSKGLATDGDQLYAAMADQGLRIYDLSNPTNPSFAGDLDTFGDAQAVDYNGDMVYLAEVFTGLTYIDVSNPALPVNVGTYQYPILGHTMHHVFYGGGYVYAANGSIGLRILAPDGPTQTGFYEDPLMGPSGAVADGNLAFITDYLQGLRVMDISNGANPVEVGIYDVPAIYYEAEFIGDLAYFSTSSGLTILDISDSSMPTLTGILNPDSGPYLQIEISGDYAYLAQYSNGLYVIDISNPSNPTLASTLDTAGISRDMALTGNHVYVTDSMEDLVIIDVSDPLSPTLAATYSLNGAANTVKVEGQYVFVTTAGEGLHILDVSDPVNPSPVGFFPLDWYGFDELEVVNGYAYLTGITNAAFEYHLAVVDVRDPANPSLFGSFQIPGLNPALAVREAEIYMPTYLGGLYIFRGPGALLAENDSPTVLGEMTTFTATSPVSGTLSFSWDFGDGINGMGQVVTHTYGAVGEYTAVVVASGMTETYTTTTSAIVDEVISGLVAGNDGPTALGSPTNLTASTAAGSSVFFSWDFGDGLSGTGANPSHTYSAPGVFSATVTAQNSVSVETAETVVVVEEGIEGLTASNDGPTSLGDPTTLTASITAGENVTYSWTFGDGATGSGAVVTHTYGAAGVYTAVVTATNAVSTDVAMTTVTVEETEFEVYMPVVVGKP